MFTSFVLVVCESERPVEASASQVSHVPSSVRTQIRDAISEVASMTMTQQEFVASMVGICITFALLLILLPFL
jgi:hypothetical protein